MVKLPRPYFSEKQTDYVLMNVMFFLHSGRGSYCKDTSDNDDHETM